MARLLRSAFSGSIGVNLDGNVGSRGGNARGDVGPLQFALLLLSSGVVGPLGSKQGPLSVPGQGTIAVDGSFGPQTAAFIKAYQENRVKTPGPSGASLPRPDGNFSNFRDPRGTGWSFGLLETDVRNATGGDFIEHMRTDSRCPKFVKELFLA